MKVSAPFWPAAALTEGAEVEELTTEGADGVMEVKDTVEGEAAVRMVVRLCSCFSSESFPPIPESSGPWLTST